MIRYVHSNSKFEKMLNALRTSEKMAVSASKKADEIIDNILQYGMDTPLTEMGKLTRHGEVRIKNCIKFDIGKGYRMVCVKDDDRLYLLFVGGHDACSAWVENNRNYVPDPDRNNIITRHVANNDQDSPHPMDTLPMEPDYEDLLMEKITERDLKIVFSGLL